MAPVVKKEILDKAMMKLNIKKLKDKIISQHVQKCGPFNITMKTICAVRVSFPCMTHDNSESAQFSVRFDVTEGILPFSIGLPPLPSMKTTLNFQNNSLSLVIHKINYHLKLNRESFQLVLPMRCTIIHQRPLNRLNRGDRRATSKKHKLHH